MESAWDDLDFGHIYNTAIPLASLIPTQSLDFGVDYLLVGSQFEELIKKN